LDGHSSGFNLLHRWPDERAKHCELCRQHCFVISSPVRFMHYRCEKEAGETTKPERHMFAWFCHHDMRFAFIAVNQRS
jgi:hypothetical protein